MLLPLSNSILLWSSHYRTLEDYELSTKHHEVMQKVESLESARCGGNPSCGTTPTWHHWAYTARKWLQVHWDKVIFILSFFWPFQFFPTSCLHIFCRLLLSSIFKRNGPIKVKKDMDEKVIQPGIKKFLTAIFLTEIRYKEYFQLISKESTWFAEQTFLKV